LNDFDGHAVKNNIITYTIGFADDQAIHDPLLPKHGNERRRPLSHCAKRAQLAARLPNGGD